MKKRTICSLIVFTVIVILSGWVGVFADSIVVGQPEGDTLGMGLWLVLPMLTAMLIILFSRISWVEIGFKLNFKRNIKWYVMSCLIFPIVTKITLIIGVSVKWIDISSLNLKTFSGVFFGAFLLNFIKNIFEETVWRGYLTSQLVKLKMKDWQIYLVVGLLWGVWHIPYYLVFLPVADIQAILPASRGAFTVVAVTTMLCWSIMFIELFRITKSLWPCVVLHTVEDSLINPLVLLGFISIAGGREILISPITGVITSGMYLVIGLGLRSYRMRQTQSAINAEQRV